MLIARIASSSGSYKHLPATEMEIFTIRPPIVNVLVPISTHLKILNGEALFTLAVAKGNLLLKSGVFPLLATCCNLLSGVREDFYGIYNTQ